MSSLSEMFNLKNKSGLLISLSLVIIGYITVFFDLKKISEFLIFVSKDGELLPVKLHWIVIVMTFPLIVFVTEIIKNAVKWDEKFNNQNKFIATIHFLWLYPSFLLISTLTFGGFNAINIAIRFIFIILLIFNYKFIIVNSFLKKRKEDSC